MWEPRNRWGGTSPAPTTLGCQQRWEKRLWDPTQRPLELLSKPGVTSRLCPFLVCDTSVLPSVKWAEALLLAFPGNALRTAVRPCLAQGFSTSGRRYLMTIVVGEDQHACSWSGPLHGKLPGELASRAGQGASREPEQKAFSGDRRRLRLLQEEIGSQSCQLQPKPARGLRQGGFLARRAGRPQPEGPLPGLGSSVY